MRNRLGLTSDVALNRAERSLSKIAASASLEHLIVNAGYEISWWSVEADEWLRANIEAVFCDYRGLERIFERCIGGPIA
ncbi:hypothetical protein [Pseudomonas tohonis]|uniref:hypothetical protein n=1 Tax=Pseudomonas tohonis TaxID=2725477 RepID=UPI001E5E5A42|nr:hypothetical protein [Pseudomonas tohonis]